MRYLLLPVFLPFLYCCTVLSAEVSQFPHGGAIAMSPDLGPELLQQCSRPAPEAKEFWQPSLADITALESALLPYLETRHASGEPTPPKESVYHRQYVGYVKDGERYIYGNFYPASVDDTLPAARNTFVVCDGGPVFWGIVFHPRSQSFQMMRFNGPA